MMVALVLIFIGLLILLVFMLAGFMGILEEEERHELYTKNKRSE
jgi:hypothetical protein